MVDNRSFFAADIATFKKRITMTRCRSLLALCLLLVACAIYTSEAKSAFSPRQHSSLVNVSRGGASAKSAPKTPAVSTEGASIPNEVFNLVKGIVGVVSAFSLQEVCSVV